MPSLIDIRRRIRSVKNTQQITKAMKMVSAAKLRRAQDRVIAARPYARLMREMLAESGRRRAVAMSARSNPLAGAARGEAHRSDFRHQRQRSGRRVQLQSDQGLAAVLRRTSAARKSRLTLVGRKGRDFFRRRDAKILAEHINIPGKTGLHGCRGIARRSHASAIATAKPTRSTSSTTNSRA